MTYQPITFDGSTPSNFAQGYQEYLSYYKNEAWYLPRDYVASADKAWVDAENLTQEEQAEAIRLCTIVRRNELVDSNCGISADNSDTLFVGCHIPMTAVEAWDVVWNWHIEEALEGYFPGFDYWNEIDRESEDALKMACKYTFAFKQA
jgi:hypothetical protein